MPVEFARQSKSGRITLVIVPGTKPVRALWTLMDTTCLREACSQLAKREGIEHNVDTLIGRWPDPTHYRIPGIKKWARARHLDAVIWTALPPKFGKNTAKPSAEHVIDYLRELHDKERADAKEYIQRAPSQIDTEYRRLIAQRLG